MSELSFFNEEVFLCGYEECVRQKQKSTPRAECFSYATVIFHLPTVNEQPLTQLATLPSITIQHIAKTTQHTAFFFAVHAAIL
jgi:hypothetical protein